jgi:DNA-binding LacI/PurR family transcriptional regulator
MTKRSRSRTRRGCAPGTRCPWFALALGTIFECGSPGIELPAQVSIAGFDDLDIAAQVNPVLTTMYVLSEEMGR